MDSGSAVWVSVSLGAYFSDERARCMMMVPGGGGARRAGWLARRLRRTFGLPRRPALLCQGHLLPPAEPLPTRAPLLELDAVPPSGRVVDVSRHQQHASDDDSDSQAVRVRTKRRRSASERRGRPDDGALPIPIQDTKPAPDEIRQHEETSELPDGDGKDEVDGGILPSPPTLDEVKRRALALLDGHEGGRRRRRRVRRRRPALPATPAQPCDAPEVLRNEEGSRRAPRHVRALSPSPPAAAPVTPEGGERGRESPGPRSLTADGHDPVLT